MLIDVHKPLRDDVRLLGELLGEVLRVREGDALYALVEEVRGLAKRGRAGSDADFERLTERLATMPIESALPVARAFAHFLALANIAEQHHRIRRRRAHRQTSTEAQRGSCERTFAELVAAGVAPERLHAAVCSLGIELVLTAHPTEVVRRSLAMKHNRIAELLAERDRTDLTDLERDDVLDALRREILSAWDTSEVRYTPPTPMEEARAGLLIFEQTLWDALPRYLRAVDRALLATTGQGLPIDATPIRFGSWMGGDRDGNPYVTSEVTRQACLFARWMAASLYHREVDALCAELSMGDASDELRTYVGDAREPYRSMLRPVRDRLAATRDALDAALTRGDTDWPPASIPDDDPLCTSVADVVEPLQVCARSLAATGKALIAQGRLTDVLRRLAAFGLTLVRLDVRQSADRHTGALDCITRSLGLGSYSAWPERERQQFLARELENPRPLVPYDLDAPADVREVLDTFQTIARLPPDSLGAYVVSMATRPSDVVAVALLQKEARVRQPLRIVPLVETAASLAAAGDMVGTLLDIPAYRALVGSRQEVMIGYSDSAREIGTVQRRMGAVSRPGGHCRRLP